MNTEQFHDLMTRLSAAWEAQNTEAGAACFTPDAVYMEPPDQQLFIGHDQLRLYFGALKPGTVMRWLHLWFNEDSQTGAGHYIFSSSGASENAIYGVCVVDIRDERIAFWREFQRRGPAAYDQFFSSQGKTWQWSIANYP